MHFADHYPWNDADTRAAVLSQIAEMLSLVVVSQPPLPPPSRFVKRGAYMVCLTCSLEARYCRCASAPPADAAQDCAERSLELRARECKGGPEHKGER